MFAALLLLGTAPGGSVSSAAAADVCPNAEIRAEQGTEVSALPNCVALEQVSPGKKGNQPTRTPTIVTAGGERVLFNSSATLGACPNVHAFGGDFTIGERDLALGGWRIECVNPPAAAGLDFAAYQTSFMPDLSRWFQVVGTPDGPQLYQEGIGGLFDPVSPVLSNLTGTAGPDPRGASADHSRLYFAPSGNEPRSGSYLAGDPVPAGTGEDPNLYVTRRDGGLSTVELIARDHTGKAWGGNCGARLGGMESLLGGNLNLQNGDRNQGAVSADGARVYFSTRPTQPPSGNCVEAAHRKRIMVREETLAGPVIEEMVASECASVPRACPGAATGDIASGSKIVSNFTPSTPAGTFAAGMIVTRIGGTGIPANTKIAQVLSPTELELTGNATVTATGVSLRANDGDDVYQGASEDQEKVYFTTTRQLLPTDLDGSSVASTAAAGATSCSNSAATGVLGCDLYLYDFEEPTGQRLTQVSLGEGTAATPGNGASMRNSITAISADGSHVYFVARTVLTTDASPTGATAQSAQNNLYVYTAANDDLAFVGTIPATDGGNAGIFGGRANWQNGAYAVPITTDSLGGEIAGDGHVLLFNSRAPLTSDDLDTARDIYRYDRAEETLQRISRADPGGSDSGDFDVSIPIAGGLGTEYPVQGRWASDDGESVVFTSSDPLKPGDVNGLEDSFWWHQGELFRLPGSTPASDKATFIQPVISPDGSTIAYHSTERLLDTDGDSVEDVYVLRPGGGFAPAPPPPTCIGEECQGAPGAPPSDAVAGSGSFVGPGNVQATTKRCPKGKRKVKRRGKVRCVTKRHGKKHNGGERRAGAKDGGR